MRRRGSEGFPFAPRSIVAEFSEVVLASLLDMREPVFGFRMNVDFGNTFFRASRVMNPHDQMTIHGESVVAELFLVRKIPVRVKPVRVARGEKQSPGVVRRRQWRGTFVEMIRRRGRAERKFFRRSAFGEKTRFIAFEQKCRNRERRFAGGFACASFLRQLLKAGVAADVRKRVRDWTGNDRLRLLTSAATGDCFFDNALHGGLSYNLGFNGKRFDRRGTFGDGALD